MKYYISLFVPKKKDSGAYGKARQDVDTILKSRGYIPIRVPFSMIQNNIARKIGLAFILEYIRDFCSWTKIFASVKKDSVLVYQHPMQSSVVVYFFIKALKNFKKTKMIAVIHDIYTLRDGKRNDSWYRNIKDIGILNEANAVICHNERMKEYLLSKGVARPKLIELGIFDYLYQGELKEKGGSDNEIMRICIAGNLSKSKCGYIYQLGKLSNQVAFELYGMGYEENNNENCTYMGGFPADKLPAQLNQNFGLVWDGDSLNECSGSVGKYTMYNNPHKVSLYLMSGLPVIIWKKAALSSFIEKNGVGILVDSLRDIPVVLGTLTAENYTEMRKQTLKISEKLRNGYFMNEALFSAEMTMRNSDEQL